MEGAIARRSTACHRELVTFMGHEIVRGGMCHAEPPM